VVFYGDLKMHPKLERIIHSRIRDGKWCGATKNGVPTVVWQGEHIDVSEHLPKQAKNHKADKYTKEPEEQHADLERPQHSGDTEDAGNGISES
jgi:hypothetical protein